jgi:hypothetical protein
MHATPQNTALADISPGESPRRGLRPGQKHSGSFRKGDDPRRLGGAKVFDGMTLAQIARKHTPECVALLVRAMHSEAVPWPTRIQAANSLLDRGHGKPVSVIDMTVTQGKPITSLSLEELEAIAAGEPPRVPVIIDGECITASSTAHSPCEDAT